MPRYDFKCPECLRKEEVKASFTEELIAPMCCDLSMKRDYANDIAGFIPTAGMYAADNR
jgi:predicted nucleic acid-binding Zn ribbon protein